MSVVPNQILILVSFTLFLVAREMMVRCRNFFNSAWDSGGRSFSLATKANRKFHCFNIKHFHMTNKNTPISLVYYDDNVEACSL